MRNIEVKILNPEGIVDAEKLMVASARLTQKGHKIKTLKNFEDLLLMGYRDATAETMVSLPHTTIQKFGIVNVVVVGVSRRFLGQITRHQNEVKFMSSSCQYSDYSDDASVVVPYEITAADHESELATITKLNNWHKMQYLKSCAQAIAEYKSAVKAGIPHDAASYILPQSLRGVLIISATPYQLKHMIKQRVCNRNTLETQYVMLRIWEKLYNTSVIFKDCGPECMSGPGCPEGRMACGEPPAYKTPSEFLDERFKYIR